MSYNDSIRAESFCVLPLRSPPHLSAGNTASDVRLIESTQLAVSEVAATVGFAYESTPLRHVRRRLKLSPRQLRSRAAAGEAAWGRASAIGAS